MPLLPETIKDYPTAAQYLGSKRDRPLQKHTRLIRASDSLIVVKYHNTYIVEYHANGEIYLNTNGWETNATKERLNSYQNRVRIWQEKFKWYYAKKIDGGYGWADKLPFTDGMLV